MMAHLASFGSWVAPVDWEADGDLDLLIGSFAGNLFLRINEGSREQPVYDTKSLPVEADGKQLHVNMHAAPVVADWDDDGLWDLVVGSGDGAVGWFANIGSETEPRFGPYQQLVSPASDSKFFEQHIGVNELPTHGTRAQICVTDYDLDGRLDLILGDYSDVDWVRKLNSVEKAEFDELVAIHARMMSGAKLLREQLYADQEDEKLQKKLEQWQVEYEKLTRKKKAFVSSSGRASFVWLFLRKDPEMGVTAAGTGQSNAKTIAAGSSSRSKPVSISTTLEPTAGVDNQWQLSVDLVINSGWHIYSAGPAGSTVRTTEVHLELPAGVTSVGPWERPTGLPYLKEPTHQIYRNKATFRRILQMPPGAGTEPIRIKVDYQACTDKYCLPPSTLRGTVTANR